MLFILCCLCYCIYLSTLLWIQAAANASGADTEDVAPIDRALLTYPSRPVCTSLSPSLSLFVLNPLASQTRTRDAIWSDSVCRPACHPHTVSEMATLYIVLKCIVL